MENFSLIGEFWRPVKGYEGLYEVSNLGRLKSVSRTHNTKNNSKRVSSEIILKIPVTSAGYCRIELYDADGKRKKHFTHRLVAWAFPEICGEWFEGAQVNHKNENKTDNRAENLEWCSAKQNIGYGTGLRRRVDAFKANGKKKVPIIAIDKKTGAIKCFKGIIEASNSGFDYRTILRCLRGDKSYKTHKGYIWRYA